MLTTRNPAFDAKLRLLRQHAMSVPDTVRHASTRIVHESYPMVGFNYRMTDIQAAVGRAQLERLPGMVARRRELADNYRRLLADIDDLELPREPGWARSNWQSFCVRLPSVCDQLGVMQAMLDAGIATRRGIMCAHLEAACADIVPRTLLPCSELAQSRCILLPLFPQLTDAEQAEVAGALRRACEPGMQAPRHE